MLVLIQTNTGEIISEGNQVTNPDGTTGEYTGSMPPHSRNEKGLMFVKNGKEWEDSYLPDDLGYKLVDI
jgi:hypothetical protein